MFLRTPASGNSNVKLHVQTWSLLLLLLFIVQVIDVLTKSSAFQIHRHAAVAPRSALQMNMLAPTSTAAANTVNENVQHRSRAEQEATMLLPNQSDLVEDTSAPFAVTLKRRGVSRVDGGVSRETARNLRAFIDDTLESSIEEVNTFKVPRAFRFANVLEKGNRFDLLLPFDDEENENNDNGCDVILEAMNELLGENGKIAPILEELLGKNAVLYELACLISDPGSNRQEIHPDIVFEPDHNDQVPLVACFVSLQDIDSTMGPTVFIPDTVSEDHHRRINNEELANEMLRTIPSNISTLGAGDCALYNPLVLHAGGGNESDRRRRLFYFTFMNAGIDDPSSHLNPGSINPILKQRNLSLEDVRETLRAHSYAKR